MNHSDCLLYWMCYGLTEDSVRSHINTLHWVAKYLKSVFQSVVIFNRHFNQSLLNARISSMFMGYATLLLWAEYNIPKVTTIIYFRDNDLLLQDHQFSVSRHKMWFFFAGSCYGLALWFSHDYLGSGNLFGFAKKNAVLKQIYFFTAQLPQQSHKDIQVLLNNTDLSPSFVQTCI